MFRLQKIQATIVPKGMSVRLSAFSNENGFWILDNENSIRYSTVPDQVINCDDQFFIGAVNSEDFKADCVAGIDIYDRSVSPETMIGKLTFSLSQKWSTAYDWVPSSPGYVTQLADCFHPPATFLIIKVQDLKR